MPTYTFVIVAGQNDQAITPPETIDDDGTPVDLADWVAQNQNIAAGTNWGVHVWFGNTTDGDPVAIWRSPSDDTSDEDARADDEAWQARLTAEALDAEEYYASLHLD